MLPQKRAEEAIVSQSIDHEDRGEEIPDHHQTGFSLSNFLWDSGSVYDAWFSWASNQVAYFKCFMAFWEAGLLISILYVEYQSWKEKENINFKNHVIQINKACL